MEIIVASLRKQVDTPLSYRYKSHSVASSSTDWTRTLLVFQFPGEAEIYLLFTVSGLGPVIIRRPLHWAVGTEATAYGHHSPSSTVEVKKTRRYTVLYFPHKSVLLC